MVALDLGTMTSQAIKTFNKNIEFKTYRGMGHHSGDEVSPK